MLLQKEILYYNIVGGMKGMGVLEHVDKVMERMSSSVISDLPQRAQDLYYYFEMCTFKMASIKQQLKDLGISSGTYYKYRKMLVERDLILVIKRRNFRGLFDKNIYSRGSQWHIQAEN